MNDFLKLQLFRLMSSYICQNNVKVKISFKGMNQCIAYLNLFWNMILDLLRSLLFQQFRCWISSHFWFHHYTLCIGDPRSIQHLCLLLKNIPRILSFPKTLSFLWFRYLLHKFQKFHFTHFWKSHICFCKFVLKTNRRGRSKNCYKIAVRKKFLSKRTFFSMPHFWIIKPNFLSS